MLQAELRPRALLKPIATLLLSSVIACYTLSHVAVAADEPATAAANPLAPNQSNVVENSSVRLNDWETYENTTRLADDSSLYQYVAEVSSRTAGAGDAQGDFSALFPDPKLRLSFVPRFNCAPLISVVFSSPDMDASEQQQVLQALEKLKFSVDRTTIAFPTLTERTESHLLAHYDAELRRRNNFRILVESGSNASIELAGPDSEKLEFGYSLSGSKRAITRSHGACLTHTN